MFQMTKSHNIVLTMTLLMAYPLVYLLCQLLVLFFFSYSSIHIFSRDSFSYIHNHSIEVIRNRKFCINGKPKQLWWFNKITTFKIWINSWFLFPTTKIAYSQYNRPYRSTPSQNMHLLAFPRTKKIMNFSLVQRRPANKLWNIEEGNLGNSLLRDRPPHKCYIKHESSSIIS